VQEYYCESLACAASDERLGPMETRRFRVILERNEPGGYTATVPSLPGCISEGDTRDEALINIQEAIQLYIESLEADGMPVPTEDQVEEAIVEVAA